MARSAKVSKLKSEKPLQMISGGGMTGTSGPTESPRTYPKGGGVGLKADFLPSRGKRSKTGLYARGL